jgi:putative oxidoreductase
MYARILTTCTYLLIVLWSYTGISKVVANLPVRYRTEYVSLVVNGADAIEWLLPATELIVVLLLFLERTRKFGLYASLLLLVVFTLYLLYMLLFVADTPCSCGGIFRKMSWQQHLPFNLFFTGLTMLGLIALHKQEQVHKNIQY